MAHCKCARRRETEEEGDPWRGGQATAANGPAGVCGIQDSDLPREAKCPAPDTKLLIS